VFLCLWVRVVSACVFRSASVGECVDACICLWDCVCGRERER